VPEWTDDDVDVRAELRALGERLGPEAVRWEAPPEQIWDRITGGAGDAPAEPARAAHGPRPGGVRSGVWLAVAAALILAVVGVAVLAVASSDGPDVVATSDLVAVDAPGSGRAEVVDRDGSYQLELETSGIEAGDGFLEVWMIDESTTRLVSLGPVRADGVYEIPAGVDPRRFPVVDVSIEPADGDPAHSGTSAVRGELGF
jgi:anti-sigma-K factor RskA